MENEQTYYADVVLPLAIFNALTYEIPESLIGQVTFGKRVEVSLRNKLYSGLVVGIHQSAPDYKVKKVISVLDLKPVITTAQYSLWEWMSSYYCCSLGEVMSVALPSGLKLSSETKVIFNESVPYEDFDLTDDEYMIAEALSIQSELTIDLIQDILNKKSVYPTIRSLLDKRILYIKEELKQKFKPKTTDVVHLNEEYHGGQGNIAALDLVRRSELQTRALLAVFALMKKEPFILKEKIKEIAEVETSAVKNLEKKGIVTISQMEISRLSQNPDAEVQDITLSDVQQKAVDHITSDKETSNIHLLHGVTGSGKTSIYIEIIKKAIQRGEQVLYLLPEIALTNQIVQRLEAVFDQELLVYHSRISNHERVEIWREVIHNRHLVVGARSSVFLPFHNLKWIIVDEEHDPSYKQDNPNPRYNARDTASYLSKVYNAQVILGSATPSVESYHNAGMEKYSYTHLSKRYGDIHLPMMELVDLNKAYKTKRMRGAFSLKLKDAIEDALADKEQVILFQNRRGFAPVLKCTVCTWTSECANCDVSLTYHQMYNEMRCHYCGFKAPKPKTCSKCGSGEIRLMGLGTEKIQEEISQLFPQARVARFDYDTANTKRKYQDLIDQFEQGDIDILVGTQMLSKGFDFDNISLVGVLNADGLLSYPDFRAEERTFQLLTQVSGRAGRRSKQGRVIIQTFTPNHPVLQDIIGYDMNRFYSRELETRKRFIYPPFYRLIDVWIRHKKLDVCRDAARLIWEQMSKKYKTRIGPAHDPPLLRVRNTYQQLIVIKLEKQNALIKELKADLMEARRLVLSQKPFRSVRIGIDVDPY